MSTRRRGRPPALTQEDVAKAVIEVGFKALTFTNLRKILAVSESTLFRYAKNRDELVALALESIGRSAAWPSLAGPWREVLTDYAIMAWQLLEHHPGAASEISRGVIAPVFVQRADELCSYLIRSGFSPQLAVMTCDLIFDLVVDSRSRIEHLDGVVSTSGPSWDQLAQIWVPEPDSAPDSTTELVRREKLDAMQLEPSRWFSQKLQIILDGVNTQLSEPTDQSRCQQAR